MQLNILTTASTEWAKLETLTLPNKKAYADKVGARLISYSNLSANDCWDRPELWLKTLRDDVSSGDYLWFMGCDTIFTNSYDWEQLVYDDWMQPSDLIIGVDPLGINTDSFLMRRTLPTLNFLSKLVRSKKHNFRNEQEAMARLLFQNETTSRYRVPMMSVKYLDQTRLNSYPMDVYSCYVDKTGQWLPHHFVFHTPGLPLAKRIELMNAKLTA